MFDPPSSSTPLLQMVLNTDKATKLPLNNTAQFWVLGRHIAYSLLSPQCLRDGDRSWFLKDEGLQSDGGGVECLIFAPGVCAAAAVALSLFEH